MTPVLPYKRGIPAALKTQLLAKIRLDRNYFVHVWFLYVFRIKLLHMQCMCIHTQMYVCKGKGLFNCFLSEMNVLISSFTSNAYY